LSKRREIGRLVDNLERGTPARREFVTRAGALGLGLCSIGALLSACKEAKSGMQKSEKADLGPVERELSIYNCAKQPRLAYSLPKEGGTRMK
jgi:hypothetical protein